MDPRCLGRVARALNHQKRKKKIQFPVRYDASQ